MSLDKLKLFIIIVNRLYSIEPKIPDVPLARDLYQSRLEPYVHVAITPLTLLH